MEVLNLRFELVLAAWPMYSYLRINDRITHGIPVRISPIIIVFSLLLIIVLGMNLQQISN